ncbi:MAG: helix-turn-helix transcriptional regulator [Pseudomonadota bacterium]
MSDHLKKKLKLRQDLPSDQERYCNFFIENPSISNKDLKKLKCSFHDGKKQLEQLVEEYHAKLEHEKKDRHHIEQEILKKNILLVEKNITLKHLLDQRENEKQEIRDEINKKVQNLILPLIGRIQTNGSESDKLYLSALIKNLNDIVVPINHATKKMSSLSSRELEICNLIVQGCHSNAIADMLCLSVQTVNTHRKNIRKKLGINSSGINLFTYIKSDTNR